MGAAAKEVAQHASRIARLELDLALIELKEKATALAGGIVLGVVALVLALFGLGFALATIAAALDTFLATWLALLIVSAVLVAGSGLLGLLALGAIKRGTPPVPREAIEEARLTTEAVKSDGSGQRA